MLAAGVDIVQLRMKDAGEEEIVAVGRRFARIAAEHGALFILNDRPDLVAAAGADGVHVGQDDVDVADARAIVGARPAGRPLDPQSGAGRRAPAGPPSTTSAWDRSTRRRPNPAAPAVGLELVRYAAEHASVPFFAIGGISPANVGAVRGAGAERVAVVRALTDAPDPAAAARVLRRALPGAGERREASVGTA